MYHYVRPGRCAACGSAPDGSTWRPSRRSSMTCRATRPSSAGRHVAAALAGGPQLPPDAVLLTFDDGHDDHHRYVLPMLAERGLPGTFFILARDPSEGLTVAHRIHVLLGLMSAAELRDAVVDALSPADRMRYYQAEADHAVDPFEDPVDDVKWVLQRDLMDVAGPVHVAHGRAAGRAGGRCRRGAPPRCATGPGAACGGHDAGRPYPRPSLDGLAATRGVGARDRGVRGPALGARPVARLAVRLSLWRATAGPRRAAATGGLPGRVRGHRHRPQRPLSTGSCRRRIAGTSTQQPSTPATATRSAT